MSNRILNTRTCIYRYLVGLRLRPHHFYMCTSVCVRVVNDPMGMCVCQDLSEHLLFAHLIHVGIDKQNALMRDCI